MLKILIIIIGIIFLMKLTFPYTTNRTKLRIYSLFAILNSIIFIPWMLLRPMHHNNPRGPYLLNQWFCKHFLGITMEIRGTEYISKKTGGIVILNHQSDLDVLALGYVWPFIAKGTVVCKKQLWNIPFFGLALWLSGYIFVDRSNQSQAIKALNNSIKLIKNHGYKIFIYPEGTRNLNTTLLSFKKGPFRTAVIANCNIQPIVISRWPLPENNVIVKRYHGIVNVLPEIQINKYSNTEDLIKVCWEKMQEELDKINNELKIYKNGLKISKSMLQ